MGTTSDPRRALLDAWRIELLKFFRRKAPADDVEDLAQEALLEMARADLAQIQTTERAYLRGVARFTLYNYYRKLPKVGEFDPDVDRLAALAPSVTRQLARRLDVERIELALQRLPLALQLMFEAHWFDGMRGPELAAAFRVPEGTVRSRLAKAKRMLDELLAEPDEAA